MNVENPDEATTHIKTDTIKLQKRLNKKINTKDNPTENETTNPTKEMKHKLQKVDIRGSLNKFPDFFRMGTFIDSTHMKL